MRQSWFQLVIHPAQHFTWCTLNTGWQYTALPYSFPYFEPVSMSGSNCCFLTCILISQEAVRWSGFPISLKIFHSLLQSTQSKALLYSQWSRVGVFLEFSCFLHDPTQDGNLISGSSASLKPSLYVCFQFTHCWNWAWRSLGITLLVCEMSTTVQEFFGIAFLGTGTKTDLFQSCGCREPVRHSARDKGHEEGGSAYANAGSSLRSPHGYPRAFSPKKTRVCLLYCFVLSPLTLLGAVPYHHLALSVEELTYSSN